MSASNFARALAYVWRPENDGQQLHTTPGDAGGSTRLGVTFTNFTAWRRAHGQPAPTLADFAAADQAELIALIRAWIWRPCGGDDLTTGVDLVVFEAAFGSGAYAAVHELQGVLGVTQDGQCGPVTLAAAAAVPAVDRVQRFIAARQAWVDGLGDAEFQRGWDARIKRDQAEALAWIAGEAAG